MKELYVVMGVPDDATPEQLEQVHLPYSLVLFHSVVFCFILF